MRLSKSYIYILVLCVIFVISPFFSFLFSLLVLIMQDFSRKERRYLYFLISLFFALLAFTQKSTSLILETDVVRYYEAYDEYVSKNVFDSNFFFNLNITYIAFDIVSRVVVSILGNVQYLSLVWTLLSYYLYFLSIDNYLVFRSVKLSNGNLFLIIFLGVTTFLLFTQITETLKQAVSISLFFYGFSLFLCQRFKLSIFIIILSLFFHLSTVFLSVFFLPFALQERSLLKLSILALLIGKLNVMNMLNILLQYLGTYSYLVLILLHKTDMYGNSLHGFTISSIFFLQMLLLVIIACYIYFGTFKPKGFMNFIFPMLIVLFLNISSPHNFDRFLNLLAFPLTIAFVEIIILKSRIRKFVCSFFFIFSFCFFMLNARKTYFRTLADDGYSSSYLDNSPVKIITYPSYLYLKQKYE